MGTTLAPISQYHPEQTDEVEQVNCTLGDMARPMQHKAKLPKIYWSYTYLTAAYIQDESGLGQPGSDR
jgi:hypothetical protein